MELFNCTEPTQSTMNVFLICVVLVMIGFARALNLESKEDEIGPYINAVWQPMNSSITKFRAQVTLSTNPAVCIQGGFWNVILDDAKKETGCTVMWEMTKTTFKARNYNEQPDSSVLQYSLTYNVKIKYGDSKNWQGSLEANIRMLNYTMPWPNKAEREFAAVMDQFSDKVDYDKYKQFVVKLPFSLLRYQLARILRFSVVVAKGPSDILTEGRVLPGLKFVSFMYSSCQSSDNCTYEIAYTDNPKSRYLDETANIGGDECDPFAGFLCNGPLDKNIQYRIGLRVYTKYGFKTAGIVNRKLLDINQIIAAAVGVSLALLIIALVIAILYINRKRIQYNFRSRTEPNEEDNNYYLGNINPTDNTSVYEDLEERPRSYEYDVYGASKQKTIYANDESTLPSVPTNPYSSMDA